MATFLEHNTGTLHQGPDPNSPDLFKQNIQQAQAQVLRILALARTTISAVQNAYNSGSNPAKTNADIALLKELLALLSDLMRHSGVGALPAIPLPDSPNILPLPPVPPSEQTIIADATRGVQTEFEQLKHVQEAAAIAANVLGMQGPAPK